MKIRFNIIFITVLAILLACSAASAQEYISAPVKISKEKIRVDGKVCYSHIVLEKQTLFSICKAYGVTAEDIYRLNPGLKENGLKKNSIIIIPSAELSDSASKPVVEAEVAQHKPSKRIHTVKWFEDLDVIAGQYGISAEEIIAANKLKGRKLSRRQKLVIPYPGEFEVSTPAVEQETVIAADTAQESVTDVTEIPSSDTLTTSINPKTKIDATVILPLTNAEGAPNKNNMDFYSGVLLAVYDLAETGLNCNLNVYDIMDNKSNFSIETITESDVVIGPVSSGDLTRLFYAVPDADAIVSPLDPRSEKLADSHPEMIQAPTPHSAQYKDLVKWMKEDFNEGDKIVMITEKGARLGGITSLISEALDSSSLAYIPFSYSILEGRDVIKPLTETMTAEGANRIIIASESEAFVNDVVRNLNLLIYNNLDIILYAPSRIRGFDTIEVDNFHNTSMHVSLGYYIDYGSQEVKDFLLKYRALYNTEPTQFAFQGYDITKYFLSLIARYGDSWKDKLSESPEGMLQSTFSFVRKPSGAFVNNGIRRIVYDKGYKVLQVK